LYSKTTKVKLGQGRFGEVFKVKRNGENIALKRLVLDESARIYEGNVSVTEPDKFDEEIDVLKIFKNSKYVIKMKNAGKSLNSKTGFIITELLNGQEFADAIKKKLITDGNIRRVAEDLLNGLDEIHGHGILHLDIKPQNLWFMQDPTAETTIKYLDFGLSCAASCNDTYFRGTAYYLKKDKLELYLDWTESLDALQTARDFDRKYPYAEKGKQQLIKAERVAQGYERRKEHLSFDKTDDFYALAKTLEKCIPTVLEQKPWLTGVIVNLKKLDATQKASDALLPIAPQNAIDALPPAAGGRRRSKTQRRRQQKKRRQSRRN